MTRPTFLTALLAIGALALQAGPPTPPPEAGAMVAVETDSFILLDPPSDPVLARQHIHAALEKGCEDLIYLNQQLTNFYKGQEADLLQAQNQPDVFHQPLSPQEEALCGRLAAAVKDPDASLREESYRENFLKMAQWFAASASRGMAAEPKKALRWTEFYFGGELYGPVLTKIFSTMVKINDLSGPARPILASNAIREFTGAELEVDLIAFNQKWERTGTAFKPRLDALETAWMPYRAALTRLSLVAIDLPWEKRDDQAPLRVRLMKRALLIHAFERHRAALGMNLQVWLLCAASAQSDRDHMYLEKEKSTEWDRVCDALATPHFANH